MAPRFLIVSHDLALLEAFEQILGEFEAEVSFCEDVPKARRIVEETRFDAVVVDCDDLHCGTGLLRTIRHSRPNKSSVLLAITNGTTNPADATDLGANFVADKPLFPDQVRLELGKISKTLSADQRGSCRYPVAAPVYLSFGDVLDRRVTTFNVSLGGLGVSDSGSMEDEVIRVSLWLPGSPVTIQARGEIAWSDRAGNAGIRFVHMNEASVAALSAWLEWAALNVLPEPSQSFEPAANWPTARHADPQASCALKP
jgi:CheY-like chemotaxis protein